MDERRRDSYFFMRLERDRCFIVSFATLACIILSLSVGLAMGKETVYTHFLYVPILLAAVWYYKKAIYVALFLSAIHILITYSASGFTLGPYIRAATFMLMAYVIGQISELRAKGKKELEKEERLSGNIITTIPDSLLVLDSDLRIKSANRTFYDTFQMKPEKVIGGSIGEILKDKEEKLNSELKKLFGTALTLNNFELPYQIQGQGERIFNVRARGIFISPEEGAGELVVIQDITERKKAEEGIRRLNEDLEQKVAERTKELAIANKQLQEISQAKSEFLASMSHELRTPLNSVIGFSEILHEKTFGGLNEKQTRYVSNIHTSGKHLLGLINDILDLSKVEAGKIELKYDKFPLAEMLSECQTLVNTMASKKGISLGFKVEDGLSTISADPTRFKQIMYNLLSNAIKFTPDGGVVNVDAKLVNGFAQVSVKDTGIGIAKGYQAKVFEDFYQVDSSYSKQYKGTGLGLPLTKKLVGLHGGKIWVESKPGKGSTFSFSIPLHAGEEIFEAPAVEEERVSAAVKEEGKPTILVVEDEKQASELLTIYLEEVGYQVVCAYDGEEAIEKAKEIKPSIITLDVILPKKDGLKVLQELKSLPETKDIPVIVISIVESKELGLSLGAADYLVKPIDKKELIRKLGDYSFTTKVKEKPVSILVVDDNPKDVELLSSILEPEGFGVIKAYGGKEGTELAIERQPDAIILDLLMPEVSGFEVVRRLREHPRGRNIPIFIYTIEDLTEGEMELLNDHVISVMQKGKCSKEDLLKDIKKVMRGWK